MNENFINVSMYLAKNKKFASWGHLTKVNTYYSAFTETGATQTMKTNQKVELKQ